MAVTVLITCAAATWFMAGLHWFVQVVHYPLFADVGTDRFIAYHARHSDRTTLVVLPAMAAELATSAWLVVDQSQGTSATLVLAGLALAILTWAARFCSSCRGTGTSPPGSIPSRSADWSAPRGCVPALGPCTASSWPSCWPRRRDPPAPQAPVGFAVWVKGEGACG